MTISMTKLRAKAIAARATHVAAKLSSPTRVRLPISGSHCDAGLEFNANYLDDPEVTIILRIGWPGFDEPCVVEGDLVIADRRVRPDDRSLVVAAVGGEMVVRRYSVSEGVELLCAPDGSCERAEAAEILATVVAVIPVTPEL
jgi:SOS-response transcriptional repressor LexA